MRKVSAALKKISHFASIRESYLKYGVRKEEDGETYPVLGVVDMNISFEVVQLKLKTEWNWLGSCLGSVCGMLTLAFPILVLSRKLRRYRKESHGIKAQSSLRMSFFSSISPVSTSAW